MSKKRQLSQAENQERHRLRCRDRHVTIRRGIRQPECEICGSRPAECHHIDYNDPERRMWLCKTCHGAYHSQFEKPAPLDWQADIRAAMKRIEAKRLALRQGPARPLKPPV